VPAHKAAAPPTKEERYQAEYAYYLDLASREDFSKIAPLRILYHAGQDASGRPIIVVVANNIPQEKIDIESLFLYAIRTSSPIFRDDLHGVPRVTLAAVTSIRSAGPAGGTRLRSGVLPHFYTIGCVPQSFFSFPFLFVALFLSYACLIHHA
jgi:hypothetical protein